MNKLFLSVRKRLKCGRLVAYLVPRLERSAPVLVRAQTNALILIGPLVQPPDAQVSTSGLNSALLSTQTKMQGKSDFEVPELSKVLLGIIGS